LLLHISGLHVINDSGMETVGTANDKPHPSWHAVNIPIRKAGPGIESMAAFHDNSVPHRSDFVNDGNRRLESRLQAASGGLGHPTGKTQPFFSGY
jgi:hypothetical protein